METKLNRKLSDEELEKLYSEIRHADAPDFWDKIEEKVQAEQTGQEEAAVLQFRKLGARRWIQLAGSIAACLLIVGGYVLTQRPKNQMAMDETNGVGEPIAAAGDVAETDYDYAAGAAEDAAGDAELVQGEMSDATQSGKDVGLSNAADAGDNAEQVEDERVCLTECVMYGNRLYVLDMTSGGGIDGSQLPATLEELGEVIPVAERLPQVDLESTGCPRGSTLYYDREKDVIYMKKPDDGMYYRFLPEP